MYLLYVFKLPSSGGIGFGVNFSVLCGGRYFLFCPLMAAGPVRLERLAVEEGEEVLATWVITCLLCRRLDKVGGDWEGGASGL